MLRRSYSMVLLCLVAAPSVVLPDGPVAPELVVTTSEDQPADLVQVNENAENSNGKQGNNTKGKEETKEPKHIRDNAFLVEEAFNQEPGDAQHIFNWVNLWTHTPEGRSRDFASAYIMELPLGSQAHQFSFLIQYLTAFEKPNGGPAVQQGDIGDIFLNYRYQLLDDDDFLWCAPRFTLILPTGDKSLGLGTGELGYQFNLPVSRYGERFDFHFNAGATLTPHVSLPLSTGLASPRHDLRAYNLGASAFWKPETYLHFFVESLALWGEEINDTGFRQSVTQVFLNPGVRYAICQLEEVEWVIGVSVPIGLTPDTPDIGMFAYMSIEHGFKKKKNNNGEED